MGGSSSRNKAVAKRSTLNLSGGEWDDLPRFPDIVGLRRHHYSLKLILIGDLGSGTTQLFTRYVDDTFSDTFNSTIGVDFKHKSITMDERRFKLQIWYVQGPILSISTAYYRGVHGVFLVYDTLNKDSFDNLHKRIHEINENTSPGVHLTLLANKCDLRKEADDHYLKGKKFADENGMAFFEVSAKDGTNVELAMTDMVARIWRTIIAESSTDD